MPQAAATKVQSEIRDINQEFKERDIQARAKESDLPYVNLINVPLNPDFAHFLSKEDSERAKAVIFFRSGKKIKMAVSDPGDTETKALIEKLKNDKFEISASLCSEESIKSAQKIYFRETYKKPAEFETAVEEKDLGSYTEEIKNLEQLRDKIEASAYDAALNFIEVGAYKTKASDIHFQPEEKHVLVRFRIDGILQPVFSLSREIYEGINKEIKHLSRLKLNVADIPQDGQYSFVINKRKINVRVSMLPSHFGEACVMRLLDAQKTFENFENLGFEGDALRNLRKAVHLPYGMILVTGPTGSGKTTTMYSMLQYIDTKAKKIITLEDPIEYNLEGITQSQVNPDAEYGFASGLRAILRQDPDVIMIGEIRDTDTAETAAQASLTGHLVITTIHTNSAVESLARLVNMGVRNFILAPAINLIIAQRLVRKLCPDCAESRSISETEKGDIQSVFDSISAKGQEVPIMPSELRHPKGCEKCGNTGFLGQVAVAEVLVFDQKLRDMMLENKPMSAIYDYINKNLRMITIREDGVLKAVRSITTLDEVYRVTA
jgi:type IV pilus assembly protein PilB